MTESVLKKLKPSEVDLLAASELELPLDLVASIDRIRLTYIRDRRGRLTGETVACVWVGDVRCLGVSRGVRGGDVFSKAWGRYIAMRRALHMLLHR